MSRYDDLRRMREARFAAPAAVTKPAAVTLPVASTQQPVETTECPVCAARRKGAHASAPRPAGGKHPLRRAGTCHPSLQGAKPVKRRLFLFWRHGCSAARNSPACKGKSLRCLRKRRLTYIDTSPALSARRHLTAALRPSRLHLGCQTHQTWCAPGKTFCRELWLQS
jgi:hypothetical protein